MKLEFLPNAGDEDEGLSDAGIETFKGSPYSSVARESGQNSRDAHRQFPVRMAFDVIELPMAGLPELGSFVDAIDCCSARAHERKDQKEIQFFQKAKRTLSSQKLYGLKISDEGTMGLIGPCKPGHPFHSLVKASGVSKKNDPTSGGSFGIGKKAAFAVSDFHTVFYSTRYRDDAGVEHFLAQGKCTLVSHENNGVKQRATGYWGREDYLPIETESEAPAWLRRSQVGTTTISMGFVPAKDWSDKITESLARNFFVAIHRGELEFAVDGGRVRIDKESLPVVMSSPSVELAAEAQETRDDLQFSKQLYDCLISPETKLIETEIKDLGRFEVRILVREKLPSKVAFVRNGMIICENLARFSDKLLSFPMYKDFVALVEPSDMASRAMFKRLENPQHNELSVDRLIEESDQQKVRKAMNSLGRWIRQSIKAEAFVVPADEVTLDEMNEFFADDSGSDRIESKDADTNPIAVTYKATKTRTARRNEGGLGEDDEGGGSKRTKRPGGKRPGKGPGQGDGHGGHGRGEDLSFEDFRNIPDRGDPGKRRILFFTPLSTGNAEISIQAKGMNDDVYLADVKFWDKDGVPIRTLAVTEGERANITVEFARPYKGPINIRLHRASGDSDETA